jgi:hypothetical protein
MIHKAQPSSALQFAPLILKAEDSGKEEIGKMIIVQAAALKCDYVVVGSRGRRGIKKHILGSVSQYVLKHSTVPVILVRDAGCKDTSLLGAPVMVVGGKKKDAKASGN